MTTYNTGNPVGSSDPRDLYDNAENLDVLTVSTEETAHDDRLGKSRRTWHGIEKAFQDFLLSSGYQPIDEPYAAGIEVTERNQIILADGEYWRVSASTEVPYTTTGAGMPEGGAFVSVGDAALRQALAEGVADIGGQTAQSVANLRGDLLEGLEAGKGALIVSGSVIYVDRVSNLEALTGLSLGQRAMIQGAEFKWNGSDWLNLSGLWTPAMYADLVNNAAATPDWTPAFAQMVADALAGHAIDGKSGSYHLASPVEISKKLRFIGGASISYDTLAVTGGALSFINGSSGSYLGGDKWTFNGPETRASWEASTTSTLHCAVFYQDSPDSSVNNFECSGSRIPLSVIDCDRFSVAIFNVVGFLPDVEPPTTGSGALVPPYMAGINWAEGMRIIGSDDVRIKNAHGDHHGNVVTLGGTCRRPYLRHITGSHMHDNGAYLSSSESCDVQHVYFEDCRGSCVKVRGSHSRVKNVGGVRSGIGVTVSPLPLSGATVPADQQVDTDAVVENVWLDDGFVVALADSVNIDGTEVALSSVTFRGIRGKTLRGLSSLGAIRITCAGEKAFIDDFEIDYCEADWPVQIGGLVNDPAQYAHNVAITNGHVSRCNTIGRVFQCRGWKMEDISSSNMLSPSSTTVIEPRSCSDGKIEGIRNNDPSYRIDCRTNCDRVSVINNRALVS